MIWDCFCCIATGPGHLAIPNRVRKQDNDVQHCSRSTTQGTEFHTKQIKDQSHEGVHCAASKSVLN